MNINIHKLIDGSQKVISINETIAPSQINNISDEYQFNSEIILLGEVSSEAGIFTLKLNIKSNLLIICSRCASNFEMPIELNVIRKFSEIEDDDMYMLEKNIISITDVINDEVFIYLPVVKLCKQSCKGICPNCGVDLNDETCHCEIKPLRGEFEKLKQLF